MEKWLYVAILAAAFLCFHVDIAYGLECYVCSNQTGNAEKCLNTIKTCEPGEDVCGTEIRYGSEPYFSLGARKQYYVSKRCLSKLHCQQRRKRYMPYCTHIWYEDWWCYECCQGDRCNYFIISGAHKLQVTTIFTTMLMVAAIRIFFKAAIPKALFI